ncbi:hypothetical protein VTJ83DRAFT_2326 [Remersonia thermophila]|uniref:WSC domain-containing protein n=1 Tax=Remersonia thermophila TaxID=72144 RepID=A0ABR4DIG1_9PEZI
MDRFTPSPFFFFFFFFSSLLLLLLLAGQAAAQGSAPSSLAIFNDPATGYVYHGCYNETTDIPNTTGLRALHGGKVEIEPGRMTVRRCLEHCSTGAGDAQGGNTAPYAFAGLEYARECWCATSLSGLSARLADDECDLPCEGNQTQACGGNLKLSVYTLNSAARTAWSAAGLVAVGAAMSFALMQDGV